MGPIAITPHIQDETIAARWLGTGCSEGAVCAQMRGPEERERRDVWIGRKKVGQRRTVIDRLDLISSGV